MSVEKEVLSPSDGLSVGSDREWRVTLTVSSAHEYPVEVCVRDRLPANAEPANVALPSTAAEEEWELEDGSVIYRTVIRPGAPVSVSYLLHGQLGDQRSVGGPAIETLRPAGRPTETNGDVGRDDAPSRTTVRRRFDLIETNGDAAELDDATDGDAAPERVSPAAGAAAHDPVSLSRHETSERAAAAHEFLVPRESDVDPVVSIVMPTMNEEAGIEECIDRAKTALETLGITGEIIVSDSSDDRTPEIAAREGAHVVTPDGEGYGYAYRYAFARARGDYVVMGDADTTYDFTELPRLFERLQQTGADMVMGSRLDGEIRPGAMPALHQYIGNPLLTKFLNVFYEAGVSDAHSGFRIIKRDALARLDLQSDGMEFASEMIMQAAERGLHIEEVPIVYHPREGEATLDSFRDGWRHVRFMLLNAPGYLFTGPAIGLALVGVAMMALSLLNQPFLGVYFGTRTMIAGCLAVILGYQIGSLGLFSAVAAEPIRSPRDPVTELISNRFKLEHGATLGLGLFGVGAVYTTYILIRWVQSGFTQLPMVPTNLLAFTALVLGVQTVFYSFFLSVVSNED